MPGAVAASSDEDLGPPVRVSDRKLADPQVLGRLQGGSFSGGAAGGQPVHAAGNLSFDDLSQVVFVNPSRAVEGSHQGGDGAAELWGPGHGWVSSISSSIRLKE